MRRRVRLGVWARWGSLGLLVVLTAGWVVTGWRGFKVEHRDSYTSPSGVARSVIRTLVVSGGQVQVMKWTGPFGVKAGWYPAITERPWAWGFEHYRRMYSEVEVWSAPLWVSPAGALLVAAVLWRASIGAAGLWAWRLPRPAKVRLGAAAGACGVAVAAWTVWLGSVWWTFGEITAAPKSRTLVMVAGGCVNYEYHASPIRERFFASPWGLARSTNTLSWGFKFKTERTRSLVYDGEYVDISYEVALWPLAGVTLVAAALACAPAWRSLKLVRQARAGRCGSCGYDRAGLAREVACPECGVLPRAGALGVHAHGAWAMPH
jgi:hypothetical protein